MFDLIISYNVTVCNQRVYTNTVRSHVIAWTIALPPPSPRPPTEGAACATYVQYNMYTHPDIDFWQTLN